MNECTPLKNLKILNKPSTYQVYETRNKNLTKGILGILILNPKMLFKGCFLSVF